MVTLLHSFTHGEEPDGYRSGITDIALVSLGGQMVLVTAARPDAGLALYDVAGNGALSFEDDRAYGSASQGLSSISLTAVNLGGDDIVLVTRPGPSTLAGFELPGNGRILAGQSLAATDSAPLSAATSGSYLFTALAGGGIGRFRIEASGQLTPLSTVNPAPSGQTSSMTGLVAVTVAGDDYIAAISASGDRVDLYTVSSAGQLTLSDSIGAAHGLGMDTPTDLHTVSIGGRSYVVVASAATSTLTVFEIAANGDLILRDHVGDTLDTRFDGVTSLDIVEEGGRAYIITGGADDGITLLELLEDGQLIHHDTMADTLGSTLADVSAVAGYAHNNGLRLYVASASEPGLTELSVSLSGMGHVHTGGSGNDQLTGGSGRDVLVAGEGADTLTGGNGQDVFVIGDDGIADTITDYDPERDVIDISSIQLLHDPSQLTIIATSNGAELYFGEFQLTVFSANGQPLNLQDLHFDFALSHLPTGNADGSSGLNVLGTSDPDYLAGGESDDLLKGFDGDDTLMGGAGSDFLDGGDGMDVVEYTDAEGRVLVDLYVDVSTAGYARFYDEGAPEGDTYVDIENSTGGKYSDQLRGSNDPNVLSGGKGWDRLYGRRGDDTLLGGLGGDALYGNNGADVMSGGSTGVRDRFIYFSATDTGVGAGNRDVITDFVAGEDRIEISRIDADTTQDRKQEFDFIGTDGFSGTAGELRYSHTGGDTIIQADTDGDGAADFEIELTGVMTLGVGDFLL